jgi:hypothetical protein
MSSLPAHFRRDDNCRPLERLRIFVAVAERQHVTRAAKL